MDRAQFLGPRFSNGMFENAMFEMGMLKMPCKRCPFWLKMECLLLEDFLYGMEILPGSPYRKLHIVPVNDSLI